MVRDRRIGRPGAAVIAHHRSAHRFDPAPDARVDHPRHHLRRDQIDRIEARRAEAMDLLAAHGLRIAGVEHSRARQHAALFADRLRRANDYVVEQAGIEIVALAQRLQQLGDHLDRSNLVQRAVGPALAARGADVIVDEGFHGKLSCVG
jgi:hypothetical protein